MAEGKTGNVQNSSQPPLGNGKGSTDGGGTYTGSHNFLTDPKGSGPATGGRDFSKENRPQTQAKPEVQPNTQEIPKGGKILYADPGAVSDKVGGSCEQKKPFKI